MTDAELADKLFVAYGFNESPETEDELNVNDIVDRNVHYTLRVMRQVRALPAEVRAMVIDHIAETEKESK